MTQTSSKSSLCGILRCMMLHEPNTLPRTLNISAILAEWVPNDPRLAAQCLFEDGTKYKGMKLDDLIKAFSFVKSVEIAELVVNPIARQMVKDSIALTKSAQASSDKEVAEPFAAGILSELLFLKLGISIDMMDHDLAAVALSPDFLKVVKQTAAKSGTLASHSLPYHKRLLSLGVSEVAEAAKCQNPETAAKIPTAENALQSHGDETNCGDGGRAAVGDGPAEVEQTPKVTIEVGMQVLTSSHTKIWNNLTATISSINKVRAKVTLDAPVEGKTIKEYDIANITPAETQDAGSASADIADEEAPGPGTKRRRLDLEKLFAGKMLDEDE